MEEVSQILDEVSGNPKIDGAVLISGKKGSFIAGADIQMLDKVHTAEQGEALSRAGQVCGNFVSSRGHLSRHSDN